MTLILTFSLREKELVAQENRQTKTLRRLDFNSLSLRERVWGEGSLIAHHEGLSLAPLSFAS
jgi:hypothetical protein